MGCHSNRVPVGGFVGFCALVARTAGDLSVCRTSALGAAWWRLWKGSSGRAARRRIAPRGVSREKERGFMDNEAIATRDLSRRAFLKGSAAVAAGAVALNAL